MRILKILCLILLCLSCCALAEGGETTLYVCALTAEVYEQPDVLAPSQSILSYGESVTVLEQKELWARIQTPDGRSGYCMLGALTPDDPNILDLSLTALSDAAATHAPCVPARKLGEIPAGTQVKVVARCPENEYLRIKFDGTYAYVPAEAFDLPLADSGELCWIQSGVRVNVYAEPDWWADPIASLSHGKCFTYLSFLETDFGNYAQICMQDGTTGYINQTSAISHSDPNVFHFTMYARLSGKLLCDQTLDPNNATVSIAQGDEITVVAITPENNMLRLRYKDAYYYAYACFFSEAPSDMPLHLRATDTVNVYMDDSMDPYQEDILIPAPYFDEPTGEMTHPSNILCRLDAGETVEVLGVTEKNNGLIVRLSDGSTGYCEFYSLKSVTEPF